jgi:hypothetical protein
MFVLQTCASYKQSTNTGTSTIVDMLLLHSRGITIYLPRPEPPPMIRSFLLIVRSSMQKDSAASS